MSNKAYVFSILTLIQGVVYIIRKKMEQQRFDNQSINNQGVLNYCMRTHLFVKRARRLAITMLCILRALSCRECTALTTVRS